MKEMNERDVEKGIKILNEVGIEKGIDNMIEMECFDEVNKDGGKVEYLI
jgi:hypothetical protein